jgi:hypothetical protein
MTGALNFSFGNRRPTKLALLIETRPLTRLPFLLLHTMQVVPSDWSFLFLGSEESIAKLQGSFGIQKEVANGKLSIKRAPVQQHIIKAGAMRTRSSLLTNLTFYNTELSSTTSLLVFDSDSILCANSDHSVDEWLQYDWVNVPG